MIIITVFLTIYYYCCCCYCITPPTTATITTIGLDPVPARGVVQSLSDRSGALLPLQTDGRVMLRR